MITVYYSTAQFSVSVVRSGELLGKFNTKKMIQGRWIWGGMSFVFKNQRLALNVNLREAYIWN